MNDLPLFSDRNASPPEYLASLLQLRPHPPIRGQCSLCDKGLNTTRAYSSPELTVIALSNRKFWK